MAKAIVAPGKSLLLPTDHSETMIAHQSPMAFATKSVGATELRNNADLISHAASAFNVPASVAEKRFSGPVFDEVKDAFPVDRPCTLAFAADRTVAPTRRAGVSIRPPDQRRRPAPQR
jgi:hypothetical protein